MLDRILIAWVKWAIFLCIAVFGSNAGAAPSYLLGAGDKVRITVYKHPDLETIVRVREQGTISLPLIGEVTIGGLEERDAEHRIAEQLRQGGFVNDPNVTLSIEEYGSRLVAVLGYVNKPGQFAIRRESTVVDLIAMAGGVNVDGADQAIVTRKAAKGSETYTVNLLDVLARGQSMRNFPVIDGDIIFVPMMHQFYVYGAVRRPGVYRYEPNLTVMKALSLAGGLYLDVQSRRGSEDRIKIKRQNANGEVEEHRAQVDDLLLANDVITVDESMF